MRILPQQTMSTEYISHSWFNFFSTVCTLLLARPVHMIFGMIFMCVIEKKEVNAAATTQRQRRRQQLLYVLPLCFGCAPIIKCIPHFKRAHNQYNPTLASLSPFESVWRTQRISQTNINVTTAPKKKPARSPRAGMFCTWWCIPVFTCIQYHITAQ